MAMSPLITDVALQKFMRLQSFIAKVIMLVVEFTLTLSFCMAKSSGSSASAPL